MAIQNEDFASFAAIKKNTIETGMLTPTLKPKKNVAIVTFRDVINAMQPDA